MKKLLIVLLIIVSMVGCLGVFMGCTTADFKIGILQQMQHEALDKANLGFREELTNLLQAEGKTVKFLNKNASGEESNCATIARSLNGKKCDLILAVATTAAQALQTATQDSKIPAFFTAITDPVYAKLVETADVPGANMTGTSDLNPVADQVDVMKEIVEANGKTATKFAVLYTTSEANSLVQVALMEKRCEELGIEVVKKGLSSPNEIATAMASISDCQAIYIPTDNVLANAAETVHTVNMEKNKLPIVCGESEMNASCGIATYGVDYYELGRATAKMAFEVLINNADIATMPVQYQSENLPFTVNQEIAEALGITIPQRLLALAGVTEAE